MTSDITAEDPRIRIIGQTLGTCARIFTRLGYRNTDSLPNQQGRQIVFENQIIGTDVSFQLTVVYLLISEKIKSLTYNFDCQLMPGRSSPIKLQDRQIKDIKLQLIEGNDYHQLTMQIYFLEPLNYSMEDLIYRVKTENLISGIRIKSGYPWLTAERHIPDQTALELVEMIESML